MTFVHIARFQNELKANQDMKQVLTGPDTLSNYETTPETATRRAITLTGTYSGTGLDLQIFVNPELPEGAASGQLEHSSNITTRGAVLNRAEVFDIGSLVTNNGETDWDGPEIAIARERVGRLRAQFTDDDIRMIEALVSVTQSDPTAIGLVA